METFTWIGLHHGYFSLNYLKIIPNIFYITAAAALLSTLEYTWIDSIIFYTVVLECEVYIKNWLGGKFRMNLCSGLVHEIWARAIGHSTAGEKKWKGPKKMAYWADNQNLSYFYQINLKLLVHQIFFYHSFVPGNVSKLCYRKNVAEAGHRYTLRRWHGNDKNHFREISRPV